MTYVTCQLWKYRGPNKNNNCPKIIASILHGHWLFEEIQQIFIVWSIIYLLFQYSINSLKTLLYWYFKCKYIKTTTANVTQFWNNKIITQIKNINSNVNIPIRCIQIDIYLISYIKVKTRGSHIKKTPEIWHKIGCF